jgi:hypothetical protein
MEHLALAPTVAVVVRVTEDSASRGLIIPLIIQTIRRDPSGSVWIDDLLNVSRPDPSGADQIDAEHQATDLAVRWACWPVQHIAVPFRSDMAAVVDSSAAGCPGWPLPQCPHAPAAVAGVRRAGACGLPVSGRPRPVSARPDSRYPTGRVDLAHLTSADAQPQRARRCRRVGTAAAGPPDFLPRPAGQPDIAAGVWVAADRTPRTPWLSAATSGTAVGVRRVGVRTVGWCPDGWTGRCADDWTVGVRRGHFRGLWVSTATETGRPVGGRWTGAATAGRRG